MLILTAIATDVHIRISSYCVKRQLWVSVIRSLTYECFSSRWQGRQKKRVTTAIPDEKAWEHLLIDVHIYNLWTTAYVIIFVYFYSRLRVYIVQTCITQTQCLQTTKFPVIAWWVTY